MVIGIMGAMPEEVAQLCEKLSGVEKETYAGVYKRTPEGRAAFLRFLETVK